MKKWSAMIQTGLIVLCIAVLLAGCGHKGNTELHATSNSQAPTESALNDASYREEMGTESGRHEAPAEPPSAGLDGEAQENGMQDGDATDINLTAIGSSSSGISADKKIIFNAFISLEVEEFDTNYKKIISMVQNSGTGYLESSHSQSIKIGYNPDRYRKEGTIVLRVAQGQFNKVLDEIRSLGMVLDERTDSQNITNEYYDTTYRTKMFETERDRIMEYLKEAKDLNTMLQLERKLSEVTYEIERLKGILRNWDNLVDFSTITIELKEKIPEEIAKNQPSTYGERILEALIDSSSATIRAIGDIVIFLVSLIPALLILGIIYLILRPVIKKFIKRDNKNMDKDMES